MQRAVGNTLILGASGRLGQLLSPQLANKGYQVVRHGFTHGGDLQADLTNADATVRLLDQVRPRFIVNLAAMTDVDLCHANPDQAFLLNARSVEHIARWASANSAPTLVHISTDQVYSGDGPHVEENACPLNVYGITKYCGERAAVEANGTVLRTNYFGAGSKSRPSLSDWMIEEFRRGSQMKLFTDILFNPLHIDSLVDAIGAVLANPVPGIFNLGSEGGMTKRDFGMRLAAHLGLDASNAVDAKASSIAGRVKRPHDMRLNSLRFEQTYGYSLPTLAEEIARVLR